MTYFGVKVIVFILVLVLVLGFIVLKEEARHYQAQRVYKAKEAAKKYERRRL